MEADLGQQKIGLASAWRKAAIRDDWRRIVDTATLQLEGHWKAGLEGPIFWWISLSMLVTYMTHDEIRQSKNVGGAFSEGSANSSTQGAETQRSKIFGTLCIRADVWRRTTNFLHGVQRSVLHGPPRPRCPTLGRASWDKKNCSGPQYVCSYLYPKRMLMRHRFAVANLLVIKYWELLICFDESDG